MVYIRHFDVIRELDESLKLQMYISTDNENNNPLLTNHLFNANQRIGDFIGLYDGFPPTCMYCNKAKITSYGGIEKIHLTDFKIDPQKGR